MNYELELSQSRPYSFSALNGDRPPLVSGSGSATFLSTTPTTIAFPAFNETYPSQAFSLEAWFLPVTHNKTGELVVIGHATEGLIWNGTSFILRIKQKAGAIIESTWTPVQIQVFHFVVTYDASKTTLFVNGELAIELEIPQTDTFLTTAGTAISIHALSGGAVATAIYDSIALYTRALSQTEIRLHYSWGNDVMDATAIASTKGGGTWSLSYQDVNVYEKITYDSSNWDTGQAIGLSAVDTLTADDEAVGGTWRQAIPINAMIDTTTPGIHLTYVGQGATLAYSTDAVTWTTIPNKTTVLEDVSTVGLTLFLQLTVTGTGWVSSLTVDVLSSRLMDPLAGNRLLAFKSAAMDQTPGNQLDFQSDWGATLAGGYVEIQTNPDPSEPAPIRSIEAWLKFSENDGLVVIAGSSNYVDLVNGTITPTGATVYRNGASFSGTPAINEWAHWVFVFSSDQTESVRLGDKKSISDTLAMSIGHLASYPAALTPAQVAALYKFNTGVPALRIDDASGMTTSEDTPAVSIYAYSWSYVSGGS